MLAGAMASRPHFLLLLAVLGCGRAATAPAPDADRQPDRTAAVPERTDVSPAAPPDAETDPAGETADGPAADEAGDASDAADGAPTDEAPDAADREAGAEADGAALPPLRDDGADPDWRWDRKARRVIDRGTLPAAFRRAGYALPEGAAVYAVRVVPGLAGPAYVLYEAGLGAFSPDFWPASTVKLLAALAALEYVRELGFTGAARVAFDPATADSLRAIVDRSIRVSSNSDYDLTLLLAGVDRLNREFLTAERGFPTTVLQRSYMGLGVPDSPECTLEEGGRSRVLAARPAQNDYGCLDGGNCANLFELTEALRRLVLHDELPASEQFALDPADRAALLDALCVADSSSFLDGAVRVLGAPPRICHKTGSVRDRDFLDHALLEDPATGTRWLLAATVPDQGGATESKAALSELAAQVLRTLRGRTGGFALQPDAGVPLVVQLDREGRGRRAKVVLTVDAPGADAVTLFLDGRPLGDAAPEEGRFVLRPDRPPRDDHLLTVHASRAGALVGYRSLRLAFGGAPAAGR
jgi:hypothetical protein